MTRRARVMQVRAHRYYATEDPGAYEKRTGECDRILNANSGGPPVR
jgi:hypothetical protein